MLTNRLYYMMKPYLPWSLRMAVRRRVANRRRASVSNCWPINEQAARVPADWQGWPHGKKFALVLTHVGDVITVTDAQIVEAMRFLWERMKLVVEPTGALAAAAVMHARAPVRGKRVGIILSGGNVDLKAAAALFQSA